MMGLTARRTFRCIIHPRPAILTAGPVIAWHGNGLPTLDGTTVCPSHFTLSYDDVASQWNAIEGMFLEGDGSFAWVGKSELHHTAWHLEGHLTDGGRFLALVELVGHCAARQLDQLLRPLGWPTCSMIFQLRDVGVYVEESVFREYLLSPGPHV